MTPRQQQGKRSPTRRERCASFLDRHATVLTILCVAALVLIPTKIAYDASTSAGDAGDKATGAAQKASHAVRRLEDERRSRIYDQNGIDHYFCGKSVAIEKVLTLLLTAALEARPSSELTEAQRRARAVFEGVLAELSEAPKCEVLIPPPPKPRRGETRKEANEREARAAPRLFPDFTQPAPEAPSATASPPSSTTPSDPSHPHGGSGGTGGHGGKQAPAGEPPSTGGSQGGGGEAPVKEAPTSNEAPTSDPPAAEAPVKEESPTTEPEASPAAEGGLVGGTLRAVEGVTHCTGDLDLGCTLGEVVGSP